MAKARMLHKSISTSLQVSRISLQARLLFTWSIAHADDEGRLKGDPEFIRAMVLPLARWSLKRISACLEEMNKAGLIYYWQVENEWFVEFIKWDQYQQIRKDRFIKSDLPSFLPDNDNQVSTSQQPDDNPRLPQSNEIETNKSESSTTKEKDQTLANKYSYKVVGSINPKTFTPTSEDEQAALDAWTKLEPLNQFAFQTTYLRALSRGLPSNLFYQFTSEIEQDASINNRGAVFNQKVEDFLSRDRG